MLYDNEGNLKAAAEEYKKALKYDPACSSLYLRLVFDYIKLGQYDDAVKQLSSVVGLHGEDAPQHPAALTVLADLYVLQGRLKAALTAYKKLMCQDMDSALLPAFIQFNMGVLYAKLDNFRAAQHCLHRAIMGFERQNEAYPGFLSQEAHAAHFYLGTLYEEKGRRPEAKIQLKRAIRLYPYNPEVLNYLGYMYAEDSEHLDEAIIIIKKALEIEPENGAYLDSLGWAYFKKGMIREALENLEKANELMPDPVISGHLEKVKEWQNDRMRKN